jgi:hypothetical protein
MNLALFIRPERTCKGLLAPIISFGDTQFPVGNKGSLKNPNMKTSLLFILKIRYYQDLKNQIRHFLQLTYMPKSR